MGKTKIKKENIIKFGAPHKPPIYGVYSEKNERLIFPFFMGYPLKKGNCFFQNRPRQYGCERRSQINFKKRIKN